MRASATTGTCRTAAWRHALAPWLFLLPYLALTGVFLLYPLLSAVPLAFQQTSGPRTSVWVGCGNFAFILADPVFHKALINTTVFTLVSVFVQLPLSLGLALLLNHAGDRMKGVFRLVLFSPHLVGSVFVGIMFAVVFTPRYGMFNRFLHALIGWGLEERWLQNPDLVMPAIVVASLWMYAGFNMIYFLAALQNVDRDLLDAARVDGSGAWHAFLHVTLPSIKPVAVLIVIMSTIGSYQLFELPYALLNGFGPKNAGLTIVGYLYQHAFAAGDLGTGAAVGWVLALIILTVSLIQLRVTRAASEE